MGAKADQSKASNIPGRVSGKEGRVTQFCLIFSEIFSTRRLRHCQVPGSEAVVPEREQTKPAASFLNQLNRMLMLGV